jgi:hypothetical protein
MGKPFKHSENLTRGDKFSLTWTGGEAGDSWDWSSVAISMKIIDTSDNSTVATLSPTTGLSGDSNEIVTAAFNVADTSAYPTGTLKGDIEVSGEPTLGTHTPVEVTIYVTADITT